MSIFQNLVPASALALAFVLGGLGSAAAEVNIKASHQWPGGVGDIRDEMVRLIAEEAENADVGLNIRVYPGESLFKAKEQWNAMVRGRLGITAFPLAYAGGRHPAFNLTLMPGLVKNHEHAKRMNDSDFMKEIKKIMDEAGVMVLSDTWLSGGFVSATDQCVRGPESVKGMQMRAAGKAFNEMLAQAGASITTMPSSEMYTAFQTGVLNGGNTSSSSLVSYRIYEQVKCLTAPGDYALWFMYEPILMAKEVFDGLDEKQQQAMLDAGEKAEQFAYEKAKEADQKLVDAYKENNVEVVSMSEDEFTSWRDVAEQSAYKNFKENVDGGQALLDKALAVE